MPTRLHRVISTLVAAVIGSTSLAAFGQSLVVPKLQRPMLSSGYYERFGIFASASGGGPRGSWFYRSGAPVAVPFAPMPASHAWAWQGRAGNHRWHLGLFADQGSSQSFSGQSATVVLPHGGSGHFFSGTWTPFVTGWIPIVGDGYNVGYGGGYGVGYGGLYADPWAWESVVVEPPQSPVRERWERLQMEQLQKVAAEAEARAANAAHAKNRAAPADEDQPPPIPQPPRVRKPDDPPLILHGP